MKKLILSAIAATLVASPMVASVAESRAAAAHGHYRQGTRQRPHRGDDAHHRNPRLARGQRFDRRRAANYRIVRDYRTYRLAPPPRGAYWARSGRDAVLVRNNGTVIRVIQRSFRC